MSAQTISFTCAATKNIAGTGQAVGALKRKRSFQAAGLVKGDRVRVESSINGTTWTARAGRDLTFDANWLDVEEGAKHYRARRLQVGNNGGTVTVTMAAEPDDINNPEPIRHQIPSAISASVATRVRIAHFHEDRTITGIFFNLPSGISLDAANYYTFTFEVLDEGGVLVGTIATFSTADGVVADVSTPAIMGAPGEQRVFAGWTLTWKATKTLSAANIPANTLVEVVWR